MGVGAALHGGTNQMSQTNDTPVPTVTCASALRTGIAIEDTGNDFTNPQPTVTRINPQLKETSLDANAPELPPTHHWLEWAA